MSVQEADFGWADSEATDAHAYLLGSVIGCIRKLYGDKPVRVLDLGCGNGYVTAKLSEEGFDVTGVDAASDGIAIARTAHPEISFARLSIYDDDWALKLQNESFDCVVSLEVVEHLLYPKVLFEKSRLVIKSGGHLVLSTPYHGYLKNLALSLTNAWDRHVDVTWDGGHIKFFSKATLQKMATEAGFKNIRIFGVGRLPWLWKSMIMVAEK